jgi:hypothetical protein
VNRDIKRHPKDAEKQINVIVKLVEEYLEMVSSYMTKKELKDTRNKFKDILSGYKVTAKSISGLKSRIIEETKLSEKQMEKIYESINS